MNKSFAPHHINASTEDLKGNQGIGRYILLPGSDGRAEEIAGHFKNLVVKKHPRGHNFYLGTIYADKKEVAVAAISTGMGCPSMEIILHELLQLGGRRFLRVGTAGSLQLKQIKMGDIINVQAAVRDEDTTKDYAPIEIPAVASLEYLSAILSTASTLNLRKKLHIGTVHCKSSFYAREFFTGPKAEENKRYMQLMSDCDVLATEMETASLFIQTQLYNQYLKNKANNTEIVALSGAILGIIAEPPEKIADKKIQDETTQTIIHLALETIKLMAKSE